MKISSQISSRSASWVRADLVRAVFIHLAVLAAWGGTLAGCAPARLSVEAQSDQAAQPPAASPAESGPAESGPAESNPAEPATVGQSLVQVSPQVVQQTTVVSGLENPWGMDWLPNGDLLVTERPGRLRLIQKGQLRSEPIAGVPGVFASGQGGLLDVAVHPDFAETDWVYFSYSAGDRSNNRTEVARAQYSDGQLTNWEVIFRVNRDKSGAQHFGSRLAWLPDQTLLISIGDGGNPPRRLDGNLIRQQAQNRSSHLGSVVRISADGSVPSNNPFVPP